MHGFLAMASFAAGVASRGAEAEDLRQISLEDLLELEVTLPGRKAEPWLHTPAAIDVITNEDIRRYGSVSLADTLRLGSGLHVARSFGNGYTITARGFSGATGNKMQVMMDGRSLYTPLFSGVFWEVQDTLLVDVDRIEVIRGPGATMWGANAVNGVINITTKDARDTLGTLIQGGGGNEELGFGAVRYGAKAGESTYWRVYSKYKYRDDQILSSGQDAQDWSSHWQSGFRSDTDLSEVSHLTFQGDFFLNDSGSLMSNANRQGGNLLGRWMRQFSDDSDLQFQLYYDRSDRDLPGQYREERNTVDADLQHRFQIGERHDLVWGLSYRVSADDTRGDVFTFDPPDRTLHLVSGFMQDEITLVPQRLKLTLGTKVEYNEFTGVEWQPGVRLAWLPTERQTIWGAVSRAVRTPTRAESDVTFRTPQGVVGFRGNPDFESEDVIAYELGYRVRPMENLSIDVAGFYNAYDSLRSVTPTAPAGIPFILSNEREGESWGTEISVRYQAADWWHLCGSYTFLEDNLSFRAIPAIAGGISTEANDPEQMASLRSTVTLPHRIEFDQVLRYVDELPNPHVPAYLELDLRLAWRPKPGLELSLVGMNLLDSAHPEFNGGTFLQPEVERSVYAKVTWLF